MKTFKDRESYDSFFSKIDEKNVEGSIVFSVFDDYEKKRVLVVVPHGNQEKHLVEVNDETFVVYGGDRNVDVLAKIAAYNNRCAYIISRVSRLEADFARPIDSLGEGLILNMLIRGKRRPVVTHKNKKYKKLLEEFHNIIKKLDPNFIVSFHGTVIRGFDVSLGFGDEKKFIGNTKKAFIFRKKVEECLKTYGIKARICVARELYVGRKDFILNFHVKRKFGCLVEFDKKGRVPFPTEKFQMLATCIVNTACDFV